MSGGRTASRAPALVLLLGCLLGCASTGPAPPGAAAPSERRSTIVEADDGHVLVVLRAPLDRPAARVVERLARDHRLTPRASWPMKSLERECVVFDVLGGRVDAALLRRLEADPAVEMAQINSTFSLRGASAQPASGDGDPHADLQSSLSILRLDAAHRRSRGRGVRVGIVDTGADFDHPDLRGRVAEAKSFVQGDESFTADRHGTAVAGVIGATRDNGVGIVGVAPEARLHLLKACWYPKRRAREEGSRGPAVCSSYTLALALDHAVDARLEVVNLSLGGPADPLLARIVDVGAERDMVFVAPAPDPEDSSDAFLAGSKAVVRAAPIPDDGAASRSPSGALLAPGNQVLTTVPGGGYDFFDGSSIAAAQVAGVIALLLEDRAPPSPRAPVVEELLRRTARALEGGVGAVVDACAALAARDAGLPASPAASFVLDCDSQPTVNRGTPPARESRRLHR